jgi:hypothetical protein
VITLFGALGALIGWSNYEFMGPWWGYLIALAVFLMGLISMQMGHEPDRSGYDKGADDSRAHGLGHASSDGGEC